MEIASIMAECAPITCADLIPGACVYGYPDGCGGKIDCPCKNGPCYQNKCVECQKKTCVDDYPGACGSFDDGCGGSVQCSCFPGKTCVSGKCMVIGCQPTTCAAQGFECGAAPDGCGGTMDCGKCPYGRDCGGGGPNKCGPKPSRRMIIPTTGTTGPSRAGSFGEGSAPETFTTNVLFHPKCGGPDLIVEEDGRVHVDGIGYITRTWNAKVDQWRDLIAASASRRGVPEAWIAGVMLQESGGQQQALSPAGAVGLMQIMPSTPGQMFQEPMSKEELWKPETNIDMGTRVLAAHGSRVHWNPVMVAAMYNAGGYYCYTGKNCDHAGLWHVNENCGYVEQVVRGINAAIEHGYSGTGSRGEESSVGWKVAAGLLFAAVPIAMVWWITKSGMIASTSARENPARVKANERIRLSSGDVMTLREAIDRGLVVKEYTHYYTAKTDVPKRVDRYIVREVNGDLFWDIGKTLFLGRFDTE